jgi:hypothetical protein
MKVFLDTSVLVAAFYGEHQHHAPGFALFVRQKKATACTAAHCQAEVYSVLTGMPGKDRASPDEALLFLGDVRDRLTTIALEETEYIKGIEEAAGGGICGGAIYDADHRPLRGKGQGRDDIHVECEALQSPGCGVACKDALIMVWPKNPAYLRAQKNSKLTQPALQPESRKLHGESVGRLRTRRPLRRTA